MKTHKTMLRFWPTRFIRRASAAIFLACLLLLGRTLAIGTNDLFHFGNTSRWWCYLVVNFWRPDVSIEIYDDSAYAPAFAWGPGRFFAHVEATGGTWAISGGLPDQAIASSMDWGFFSAGRITVAGRTKTRYYALNLEYVPPCLLVFTGAITAHWLLAARRARRTQRSTLCPRCSYDTRVHQLGSAGDKCPECGTPIAQTQGRSPASQ